MRFRFLRHFSFRLFLVSGILLLASCIANSVAHAVTCELLSMNVDDARTRLKQAANETDFDSAKDYVRRAKSALGDAAMSAMDCGCDMAAMEFDTAETHARHAQHADSVKEFVDSLNRAIRAFNSAIAALVACSM